MTAIRARCTCAPSAVPMTIEELCPQCRESRQFAASSGERRVEQGLRRLGTEHAPAAGWKERVLASVREESRRRRRVGRVVIAAAIAVGLALLAIAWRRSHSSDSDLKLEITIEQAHH